jgi:hypothetical protein
MLRRSEVHYPSGREVKMDIPANNFSHLYLATPVIEDGRGEGGIP